MRGARCNPDFLSSPSVAEEGNGSAACCSGQAVHKAHYKTRSGPRKIIMKKILIAEAADAIPIIKDALGDTFDLTFCTDMDDVIGHLSKKTGLILCGAHFDDCQMYELLKLAKSLPHAAPIPFLGVRLLRGKLRDDMYETVQTTIRALGGEGFIDYFRWSTSLGEDYAKVKFRICVDYMALDEKTLDRRNHPISNTLNRREWR